MASKKFHNDEISLFLKSCTKEGKRNKVTMELTDDFLDALDEKTLDLVLKTYTSCLLNRYDQPSRGRVKFNEKYRKWYKKNDKGNKEEMKWKIVKFILIAIPEIATSPTVGDELLKRKEKTFHFKEEYGIKVSDFLASDAVKDWWKEHGEEDSDEEVPLNEDSEEEEEQPAKKKRKNSSNDSTD